MNDTQSHFISDKALKMLLRLSGLKHEFIAGKLGITPTYFWMIINGERKAQQKRKEIYTFLIQHNQFLETFKIAA